MKGHKKTAAILLAAIMILAPTLIMAQVSNVAPVQKPTGEPLDIEVWTNKEEGGSFGQGENLVIYFRANRDCYVTVYDLDTKGDINLLYPYDYRDNNYIEGGVVYTIPDYYDDFVLRVNGPPGLEFVQAIASDRDFPVPDWSYNFRDPEGWRDIDNERDALAYLEFINSKYFQATRPYPDLDLDYAYFEVRKNWKYSWDSYYYDDYSYYDDDVNIYHYYHPYYYRPVYYDPYWDPWDWCGTMYIGWPYGGAIWINGIFYGYAPLFIPRVSIGWCNVRIYYNGRDYYHDRVRIRRGLSHELYHEGGYKWKTSGKAGYKDNTLAKKYYPKEKSISYRSAAKYTFGGKSGKTYKTDSRTTYNKGKGSAYKPSTGVTKTRDSYGTKSRTTVGKDKSRGYSKTGTTTGKTKTSTGKPTYTKEGTTSGKSKTSGSPGSKTGSKSGTYDKGTKTKSSSGSSGSKSDKTRKSHSPSARFEQKGERTAYGSSDNAGSTGSSRSYGKSGNRSSGNSGSPGYKSSGTSRSKSGSSTYGRGSSSSRKSSGTYSRGTRSSGSKSSGTYSRGTRSSGSKSSGSYRGSSGSSRSSGKSSGSRSSGSSKSSGGSRGSSKSRK
jgi:hypothetical protein